MNDLIFVYKWQQQWIFCLAVGLVLSTPGYAETHVKPNYPSSTDTSCSCAVPWLVQDKYWTPSQMSY
jgi:hypothetical protein